MISDRQCFITKTSVSYRKEEKLKRLNSIHPIHSKNSHAVISPYAGLETPPAPPPHPHYLRDINAVFTWSLPLDENGDISPNHPKSDTLLHITSLGALLEEDTSDTLFSEYYEAYAKNFPCENERDTQNEIRRLLESQVGDWDISIIRHGEKIIAGYHTKLINISEYGVFSVAEYLWSDKAARGTGLGKLLYERTIRARREQGSLGHFGEIRDVEMLPVEEMINDKRAGTTADKRIGFWKKQNRLVLDAPWLQPPLHATGEELDYLMLTLSPLDDTCPKEFSRTAYLELFHRYYSKERNPKTYANLEDLTSDIETVPLIPIGERRSFIRDIRDDSLH